MTLARCKDCGGTFERNEDEVWKVRCISCFKKSKRAESFTPPDNFWQNRAVAAEREVEALQARVSELVMQMLRQPKPSPIDRELAEQLPRLLLVCHPDKHNGSQAATKATQWLLNIRGRLQ